MQTGRIKTYAPKARRDFIAAVTRRAAKFGLTAKAISPNREEGQLVFIEGQAYPKSVGVQRQKLAERIRSQGFQQVMEAAAYTWFNRLIAIRFMELHGYLDHPFRVLSPSPSSPSPQRGEGRGEGRTPAGLPEILDQAQHVDLPGLDRERVITLKMDGTQDESLYRDLLLAQCRALHRAMPFLFEPVDDETELLLPDNLLQTDSLIRELVTAIPEEDWQEIEIIGWLYQFYISEKKDQVIGKVVKSEDIPAATQLFTPNWIVKYMVQNSLGAQWLATNPDSPLKGQMEYYIEPAEQTPEVGAALAALTPASLNPEELTLMDPACGSGHILVEAYGLFKAIYLERGYRLRDIPRLILEKNLFGLDIDARAAQLAGFVLMMKARADDRRLFERGVKLNVMALVDSMGFDPERLSQDVSLADYGLRPGDLTELNRLFEHATTFGSRIQVPEGLTKKLAALKQLSGAISQDLFVSDALKRLEPLVQQAGMLAKRYDAVVANPPYMGPKGMNTPLKKFAKDHFADAKGDLFACFIERGYTLAESAGYVAMVTMQSWMFLSSFQKLRQRMLREKTICTMAHLGARAFGSISGEIVQTTSFVLKNEPNRAHTPVFFRLLDAGESEKRAALTARNMRFDTTPQRNFAKIPGSPLAYWVSDTVRKVFSDSIRLEEVAELKVGMATSDNERFLRHWQEVSACRAKFDASSHAEAKQSQKKWFPYSKGGAARKWYGNNYLMVNWENDGQEVVELATELWGSPSKRIYNRQYFFRDAITWSLTSSSSGGFCARWRDRGFIFDVNGMSSFVKNEKDTSLVLCAVNSCVGAYLLSLINPTMAFQAGDLARFPIIEDYRNSRLISIAETAIALSKGDWDSSEEAWDFQSLPILTASSEPKPTLQSSYTAWITQNRKTIAEMKRLEEENNRLFIDAYGLQDELTPEVPIEQITLTVNPAYRYGGKLSEEEQWTRFREDTMQELVSYAIGCAMGRYSLDEPGLIYAHSGNGGFDPSHYSTFPADGDGITPVTDTDWFDDDAAHRVVGFISVAWDKAHLEENLRFLAANLSPRKDESSRETLRRYLCDSFFKDHLQTYKNRPIYWCFTSGKQKAFQCLVYLHRYNEGTLARMRMEYVVPLQSKMAARIDKLSDDIQSASTSAQAKRLQKERDKLTKQLDELRRFDEQLRHYADQRIQLDLDDGVKVNYGKFGDLLAEVKAITGHTDS